MCIRDRLQTGLVEMNFTTQFETHAFYQFMNQIWWISFYRKCLETLNILLQNSDVDQVKISDWSWSIDRSINHRSNWSIMIDQWQNDWSFTQKFILTSKKKSLKFRFNNFSFKKRFFQCFFQKKLFFVKNIFLTD